MKFVRFYSFLALTAALTFKSAIAGIDPAVISKAIQDEFTATTKISIDDANAFSDSGKPGEIIKKFAPATFPFDQYETFRANETTKVTDQLKSNQQTAINEAAKIVEKALGKIMERQSKLIEANKKTVSSYKQQSLDNINNLLQGKPTKPISYMTPDASAVNNDAPLNQEKVDVTQLVSPAQQLGKEMNSSLQAEQPANNTPTSDAIEPKKDGMTPEEMPIPHQKTPGKSKKAPLKK